LDLETFSTHCDLVEQTELERVELLAYYLESCHGATGFSVNGVAELFETLRFSKPNLSRLRVKISKSKSFVKGGAGDEFRLGAKKRKEFISKLPSLAEPAEEAKAIDGIIPISLVSDTRGYVLSLAKQINVSYENSVFDGTAVLMRRLVEVLLIHSFDSHGKSAEIQDSEGSTKSLNSLISIAVKSSDLKLSKPVKACLDTFRQLGNFSAHSIHYNAKKSDIKSVALDYRVTIEELLYKSGIKK